MEILLQDFRNGVRQFCKVPGFTAIAVLTLALGIGANTAIFSVIYAVLLRPLPFHDPGRIVAVKTTEPNRHDDIGVSYPAFLDWRSRNHVFEALSAFRTDDFTLTGKGEPLHLTGGVVSANTFSLLGIAPVARTRFQAGRRRSFKHRATRHSQPESVATALPLGSKRCRPEPDIERPGLHRRRGDAPRIPVSSANYACRLLDDGRPRRAIQQRKSTDNRAARHLLPRRHCEIETRCIHRASADGDERDSGSIEHPIS